MAFHQCPSTLNYHWLLFRTVVTLGGGGGVDGIMMQKGHKRVQVLVVLFWTGCWVYDCVHLRKHIKVDTYNLCTSLYLCYASTTFALQKLTSRHWAHSHLLRHRRKKQTKEHKPALSGILTAPSCPVGLALTCAPVFLSAPPEYMTCFQKSKSPIWTEVPRGGEWFDPWSHYHNCSNPLVISLQGSVTSSGSKTDMPTKSRVDTGSVWRVWK